MLFPPSKVYIDGSDIQDEGQWVWSDKKAVAYSNWHTKYFQPDGGKNENYILLMFWSDQQYYWFDVSGEFKFPAMCEL